MNNALEKAIETGILGYDNLYSFIENAEFDEEIFKAADIVRKREVGDEVHLRALIEFSNTCSCNCKYCGLRRENANIERYNLAPESILDLAKEAKDAGLKTVVLQSGENSFYSQNTLCELILELKKLNLAVTLSIGEKTYEEYKAYKIAGADRFLLRIETTDEALYQNLHPKMSFTNRVSCLTNLKTLGYEVGSGLLVGLLSQSTQSLANDLLFLQKLEPDMVGIGPFIPHQDTPLKNADGNNFTLSLKIMALARLLLPNVNIPATTAMETLHPNGRIRALQSGANVVMPNITACKFRKKYEIYPGKAESNCSALETLDEIKAKIKSINRTISTDYGTSKNWQSRKHHPII